MAARYTAFGPPVQAKPGLRRRIRGAAQRGLKSRGTNRARGKIRSTGIQRSRTIQRSALTQGHRPGGGPRRPSGGVNKAIGYEGIDSESAGAREYARDSEALAAKLRAQQQAQAPPSSLDKPNVVPNPLPQNTPSSVANDIGRLKGHPVRPNRVKLQQLKAIQDKRKKK